MLACQGGDRLGEKRKVPYVLPADHVLQDLRACKLHWCRSNISIMASSRSSSLGTSRRSSPTDASLQQRSSGSGSGNSYRPARSTSARKRIRRQGTSEVLQVASRVDDFHDSLHAEEDEDNELACDSDSKTYMACIVQGHRLGVAYFDVATGEMFVMEAWEGGEEEYPCLQMIKYQVEPETIFTSTKMDDHFLAALQQKVRENGPDPNVKLAKSALFSHQQARHRLAYLQVKGMDSDLNNEERIHVLNSMINLESEMQVRAAGGLLAILQQEMLIDTVIDRRESHLDGHPSERVQIEGISELSLYCLELFLKDRRGDRYIRKRLNELKMISASPCDPGLSRKNGFLYMDATTHDALQIFQLETHASAMGIGKAKEGFSVFGMLNKCVTLMGRRLLRLWFLRPILDLAVLNDRLDSIQVLKSSTDMIEALQGCLKHVKDVPRILKKILSPSSRSASSDWFTLVESIGALWQMRGILDVATSQRHHSQKAFMHLQIIRKVFASISEDLVYVSDLINGVIDFDQVCGDSFDTMVAYGLCDELDELKRLYEGLPDFLHKVTSCEQRRLPSEVRSASGGTTVYIPQVGYFMRFTGTPLEKETLESLPDFEFAFQGSSEDDSRIPEFFYRTSKTRELDNDLGDIYHKILDMERAILRNLETRVEQYSESLNEASKVAAEIDCILALTISAREYNYVRPDLTEENILIIKNGRHVLQEMTVDRFVPNDTDIGGEGRISIVTGPNYSGKSIYAKQVALIVFLAHIGSFVPADQATVGLTDRIFTRIMSRETMAVAQSTFMIDLNQIAVMLRHSTSRSLCIIDEFGKGTLTEDGIGLLFATLNHFASLESPPKVFAITHFTEVSDEGLLPKSPQIAFHTMSILDTEENQNLNPLEDIVFLYRLVPGFATSSYGIHCAELAGLPSAVLDRSKEVLQHVLAGESINRHETPSRLAKDQMCQDLVERFLAFDCENGDVEAFMKEVRTIGGIKDKCGDIITETLAPP